MGTTSFLFLRRVQAVYHDNRMVQYAFILVWAVTSGIIVMLFPGIDAMHIPGTGYCIVYKAQHYVPITNFMPAVFDSLVFFAISYKIAFQQNQELGSELSWTRSWFSTGSLPIVTRAFLQGGQQYYLSVISTVVPYFSDADLDQQHHFWIQYTRRGIFFQPFSPAHAPLSVLRPSCCIVCVHGLSCAQTHSCGILWSR